MEDHDQRIKALLREFIDQFMQLFFPKWADLFDWSTIEWLDKELFSDPPVGERRYVDLLAKLKIREAVDADQARLESDEWLALIHVEVESADAVAPFPKRMFQYFPLLASAYQLPILPIAVYMRVGKDGIGTDVYTQSFWDFKIVEFNYHYIGLPALKARDYLDREQVLAAALAALMKVSPEDRLRVRADALKRIVESDESKQAKYLLAECVHAYMKLDASEEQEFDKMVRNNPEYKDIPMIKMAWYKEGEEAGLKEGERRALTRILRKRFGEVPPALEARLGSMSDEDLDQLLDDAIDASRLEDLRRWIH